MASFLLCGGSRGRRYALPHSRVMIHQPMGGAQGQAEDIRVETSQILRIRNNIVKLYSMMTGQTPEQLTLDLDRFVVCKHSFYLCDTRFAASSKMLIVMVWFVWSIV